MKDCESKDLSGYFSFGVGVERRVIIFLCQQTTFWIVLPVKLVTVVTLEADLSQDGKKTV